MTWTGWILFLLVAAVLLLAAITRQLDRLIRSIHELSRVTPPVSPRSAAKIEDDIAEMRKTLENVQGHLAAIEHHLAPPPLDDDPIS